MPIKENEIIDSHMHVGVMGDSDPKMGKLSEWYRQQLTFKIFLLYARIEPDKVCDKVLHEATVRTITTAGINRVVCLALDHVYDRNGNPRPDASHVWVANKYVFDLKQEIGEKVLVGGSVHPYRPDFRACVDELVQKGAVLCKWLPSAQQFSLADPKVGDQLEYLAKAKGGKPFPLLLHCGPEYAIPTSNEKTWTYDFISWDLMDRIKNLFGTWYTPDIKGIDRTLRRGLDAGAVIIFAHCGLPYFSSGLFGNLLEHSDFGKVEELLRANASGGYPGRSYADVSALCTPMRKGFFPKVARLPPEYLLFGSDFPTPAFELFADEKEVKNDFKAVMAGHFEQVIIPQDNLLDVNYWQLRQAFPGHPLFTNFAGKLAQG